MTAPLPSFARVAYTLEAMEEFYCRAGDICELNARRSTTPRDLAFLRYMASETRTFAALLKQHRETRGDGALDVWLQATPDAPPPAEGHLWELRNGGWDPAHALLVLRGAAQRWMALHHQLEMLARTDAGRELHANLKTLSEAWCRKLSAAYLQLQDV